MAAFGDKDADLRMKAVRLRLHELRKTTEEIENA